MANIMGSTKSNFYSLALSLCLGFMTTPAMAMIVQDLKVPVNPEKSLQEGQSRGLGISELEKMAKADLTELRREQPERFKVLAEDLGGNPLVRELFGNLPNIEKAKTIARNELFKAIQKNWKDKLQGTVLNEPGGSEFSSFEPYLKRELESLNLTGTKDGYHFEWRWGTVQVSKNFREFGYRIEVSYQLDDNKVNAPSRP